MNGTVPTLVVPMLETTGPESDSRYRSLRDTIVSNHTSPKGRAMKLIRSTLDDL